MIQSQTERDRTEDCLVNVPTAAKILSLSRGKVYQLMESGALPYIKIGKCRRVERQALRDLVNRHRLQAS
jgi:excisionase family DNA binding protein